MSSAPPAYNDAKVPQINLFPSLQGQRIVLCSGSPRRLRLLQQIGLSPEVIESQFAENLSKSDYEVTPWEYAIQTATEKILAVYRRISDDRKEPRLLIAADTIILAGHRILEKPKDPADHLTMLRALRKQPHKVLTAVAVLAPNDDMPVAPGYILKTHLEETTVTFDHEISDDILAAYVQTGEGKDKAGGYAIQGQGALLIKRIDGASDNVIGLPLNATYRLIQEVLNFDVYQLDGDEDEGKLDE